MVMYTETALFFFFLFKAPRISLASNQSKFQYLHSVFLSNTCLQLFEDQFIIVIRSIICRCNS